MKRLEFMPYANAYTREERDGSITLVSYVTEVAKINADGSITCNGLYSATTRRHISAFAREYGLSYYDFKRDYELRALKNSLEFWTEELAQAKADGDADEIAIATRNRENALKELEKVEKRYSKC